MRIAMWSGPRNLSTAMMYAFGNRKDFVIVDEPFYAAYLVKTGLNHPMRDAIIASQPNDPNEVALALSGPIPDGKAHFYQKHMTQHMIEGMPTGWMSAARQVFLLRHPARVIASFAAKYPDLRLPDIGFVEQSRLYDAAIEQGQKPVVIDSFVSTPIAVESGEPQGSVLGAEDYKMYTSPVGDIIRKHGMRYSIYADDSTKYIYFTLEDDMDIKRALETVNRCVTELKNWMTINKLQLNEEKN